jgi:Holliday junction resolvasome RuvABC endonuclease subunit
MPKNLSDFRKEVIDLAPVSKLKFSGEQWVLAIDQSMASTGWVLLASNDDGEPIVIGTGMIVTNPTGKGSFEDTYGRMLQIEDGFMALTGLNPSRIVHEMPAVYGKRTEASLLASVVLRLTARRRDIPISMVAAQKMKRIIAGKPNASKDEVRAAVKSLLPDIVRHKPLNEHVYDAAAIGLASMVVK